LKRYLFLLTIFIIVGLFAFIGLKSAFPGFATPEIKIITTPTTSVVNGPVILDAIHNQSRLETVSMELANDQDVTKVWGLEGACREGLTYLGYFTVTAGVDLQKLAESDIVLAENADRAQTAVTITLPPASILHVELDTQRSRVVHDDVSIISQLCGTQLPQMVLEAQADLRKSAEISARKQNIIKLAQDRASFEIQKLLLKLGYTNVTIQFNEAYDDQPNPTPSPDPTSTNSPAGGSGDGGVR
jgi:hypothetical protein